MISCDLGLATGHTPHPGHGSGHMVTTHILCILHNYKCTRGAHKFVTLSAVG